MELAGHRRITKAAIEEFLAEVGQGRRGIARDQLRRVTHTPHGVMESTVADAAVTRDILDVLNLGHWSNFAQKHHFMRRFDGQSPYQAWLDGCTWIHDNALAFAKAAAQGSGSLHLQKLGNACHAVEDSFAKGHAVREAPGGPDQPGDILRIKRYAGTEKENHEHHDKTWWNAGAGVFSLEGQLAKNAVKGLVHVVFGEVFLARSAQRPVTGLSDFPAYRHRWLRASPHLSRARDQAYDLVDQFYSGIVWGDSNLALNFDEEGLARAVHDRLGAETRKVHAVFQRLDEHHNVDADDVAEYYVNILRQGRSPEVAQAVGRDRELVDLLIRILDEGWTSRGEQDCIDWLRRIRR